MEEWSDFDVSEGDDWLYDPSDDLALDMNDNTDINTGEYMKMANRKLLFHSTCTYDNCLRKNELANLFLSEAELFLNNSDYESALVAAYAADICKPSIDRKAIETICLYQLGDRETAVKISSQVNPKNIQTAFLKQRFVNTVEVLEFMPQLLGMLSQMGKDS